MVGLTSCKVCGAASRWLYRIQSQAHEPDLDVFRCSECGLLFVGTSLDADHLTAAYDALDPDDYYAEIERTTEEKMRRARTDLEPLLGEEPRILDVGCGDGSFLQAIASANPHVKSAGYEIPGKLVEKCRAKGLDIRTGPLNEIEDRWDICTLLDVAEHVPDPNKTFSECRALLTERGHVYIRTPRISGLDSFAVRILAVPGLRTIALTWLNTRLSIFHLQLWSDEALVRSLELAGLAPIYLRAEFELSWPLDRYIRVYLIDRFNLPRWLGRVALLLAEIVFVRVGLMRNKGICLARVP